MATTTGYVPAGQVIASAARRAGDPTARIVRRPIYLSFVQEGLEAMSFDTQYERRFADNPMTESGVIELPKWMTSMKGVWVYNGDRCNPLSIQVVYGKEGYAGGFSQSQWSAPNDIMQTGANGRSTFPYQEPHHLRYYGIVGSQMHLSPQCRGYSWVRIEYSGIGIDDMCDEGDILVPLWARQAIADYAALKALELRQYQEGKQNIMRSIMGDLKREMESPEGSWAKARMYWGGLDEKDRFDTHIYVSRLGRAGEHI